MKFYSDSLYTEILEDDAHYNTRTRFERKIKNARRDQRRAKQAQRDSYYDNYWTVH